MITNEIKLEVFIKIDVKDNNVNKLLEFLKEITKEGLK